MQPDNYWSNTTECVDGMSTYTYIQYPAFEEKIVNGDLTPIERTKESLDLVKDLSGHLWYCNSALNSTSWYFTYKFSEFNGFGHVMISFL